MGAPVVVVSSGGLPVTEAANGFGTPIEVAANGFGMPITYVSAGGMPVISGGSVPVVLNALNTRIEFAGDSITFYDNFGGYKQFAGILSGGRYYTDVGYNQGKQGDTSFDLLTRLQALAPLATPFVSVILIGVNDGFAETTTITNVQAIIARQKVRGAKRIFIITVLPDENGADRKTTYNGWLRNTLSDPIISIIDPYNSGWVSSTMLLPDKLHPTSLGAKLIGSLVAAAIAAEINPANMFTGYLSNNKWTNQNMLGSITPPDQSGGGGITGTGVIPTGCNLFQHPSAKDATATVVASKESQGSYDKTVINIVNPSANSILVNFSSSAFFNVGAVAGDKIEGFVEFEWTGVGLGAPVINMDSANLFDGFTTGALPFSGMLRARASTKPSGLSSSYWTLNMFITPGANLQVKVGRVWWGIAAP